MDLRKAIAVDEKFISRSYFKDEKGTDSTIPSKRSSKLHSKNSVFKKPAEVFRTDFITAMKIPDSQPLPVGSQFITLKDTWRQEWEKGVQVPVNSDVKALPKVKELQQRLPYCDDAPFKLPDEYMKFDSKKYACTVDRSSTACNYDLDDIDMQWLTSISQCQSSKKTSTIDELTMERAITYFERQCFEKMAHAVATKEGLSIEYDENTTCNICLSPDAEDGNEIIFCDACNMCAHQHCYGVLDIPEGNWLCNPCSRGILSPPCCLCPNKGGAMKRIKDSYEWIHVICAWWIPEVKIEDSKYIERITKDKIPSSRWNLSCCICRDKSGACVQCSVKRCVRAYHVTCAVKEGLEMKTVIIPDKDDVQHISFCSKHCIPVPPEENPNRNKSGEDFENNRLKELRKLECEFYSLITVSKSARVLSLSRESTRRLHSYWTMKRRDNGNAPLIKLTLEEQEKLSGKQGLVFINQQKTLEMERFLHLRQDLERLRNLCYMIVRREKMRKELHRTSKEIFYKQNDIVVEEGEDFSLQNLDFLRHRSTKFSKFSEFYQTEKEYENETGVKVTLFNESFEEPTSLLNNSRIEILNPCDLERKSPDKKGKIKLPKNSCINVEKKSDRNIFDLLEPDVQVSNDKNDVKGKTVDRMFEENAKEPFTEMELRSTKNHVENSCSANTLKTKLKDKSARPVSPINGKQLLKDKNEQLKTPGDIFSNIHQLTNKLFHQNDLNNGHENDLSNGHENDDDDDILFCPIKDEKVLHNGDDVISLPNNSTPTKQSKLVKRGKKRFRNLHDDHGNSFVCRNSPRFNKPIKQTTLGVKFNTSSGDTPYTTDEHEPLQLKNVRKRRRLDSSDVCASEVNSKKDNFSRVTRSRVSSCS